jgi:hypothetical protein
MTDSPLRPTSSGAAVPAEYQPLYKYLDTRFADVVVLTFVQIEDLVGHVLPDQAYVDRAWWSNEGESGTGTAQAAAWGRAHRLAHVNLAARTVRFERAQR